MSFETRKLHELCDDKGKTVTLITTSTGNICGGFTSVSWASGNSGASDKEAFLFSLDSDK